MSKKPWIFALPLALMVVLLLSFRVGAAFLPRDWQGGLPFVAVFFCAGVYWKRCSQLLPAAVIAWIVGSPVSNWIHGFPAWNIYSTIALVTMMLAAWIGIKYAALARHNKPSLFGMLGGTLAGAVLFYLITNTGSFFADPLYVKNLQGWVQALWTGLPSYNPTWMFFRNSLCANTLFTLVFYLTMKLPSLSELQTFTLASAEAKQ